METTTFEIAVLVVVLTAIAVLLFYTFVTGISPVPTTSRVARTMMALLPDELDGTIFEVGSGWGTLALRLARRYPRAQVIGYELSPVPYLCSKLLAAVARAPNLAFRRADFMAVPLDPASLVVCYLYPKGMTRLKDKLAAELRPGALVLSSTFAVPGWNPVASRRADDLYRSTVYLYRMPALHQIDGANY